MTDATKHKCTCGIIMPISHTDDHHTEAHWKAVLDVICEAIERAEMIAQPVWQNADFDVIQAKILRNLFENEIIICDVSTRNPNVMLELGMRLTTKRPTIIIAESGTKLPFDTSVINTEFYDPSLTYADIAAFVAKLTQILIDTRASSLAGTYHAYLEHFEFETVKPNSVTVSGEEAIAGRLDEMNIRLAKLDNRVSWLRHVGNTARHPATDVESGFPSLEAPAREGKPPVTQSDLGVGMRVFHEKFGFGAVADVDGNKIEVDFDTVGSRRVLASFLAVS